MAISFLVCEVYNGLGDCPHTRWLRLEAGDSSRLDRLLTGRISLIPLPGDHECFQHVPDEKLYQDYQAAWAAEREIDAKLCPCLSLPQLRVLPAGGTVKGAVVVHVLSEREQRVGRMHRFEAPGATVPFAGGRLPIFHVLSPDLVGRIARHYLATRTVPDGASVGSGLTWVPRRRNRHGVGRLLGGMLR